MELPPFAPDALDRSEARVEFARFSRLQPRLRQRFGDNGAKAGAGKKTAGAHPDCPVATEWRGAPFASSSKAALRRHETGPPGSAPARGAAGSQGSNPKAVSGHILPEGETSLPFPVTALIRESIRDRAPCYFSAARMCVSGKQLK
jgi:hypothetical protein